MLYNNITMYSLNRHCFSNIKAYKAASYSSSASQPTNSQPSQLTFPNPPHQLEINRSLLLIIFLTSSSPLSMSAPSTQGFSYNPTMHVCNFVKKTYTVTDPKNGKKRKVKKTTCTICGRPDPSLDEAYDCGLM